MDDNQLKEIFQRYLANKCSPEELALLQSLLADKRYNERWVALLDETWSAGTDGITPPLDDREAQRILQRILTHGQPKKIRKLRRWHIAAAMLLIIGMATLTYFQMYTPGNERHLAVQTMSDVAPGGYKASLTYGHGKTVELNADQHGIVVVNDLIKYTDGTTIDLADTEELPAQQYYELRTPRGGTYHITLSDGTKVWLNSESSLRYPAQFGDGDRHVVLSGEAYFEVTKKHMESRGGIPFYVSTSHQTVTVLGTQFNLTAYPTEPHTMTTLIEGSVRVSRTQRLGAAAAKTVTLKPGQQAIASADNNQLTTQAVHAFQTASWKDRLFVFNDEPLADIMKRLARWYDFEVSYSGGAEHVRFTGNYDMDKGLRNLLENIELTEGIRFKLEELPNKERRVIAIKD